MPMSETGQNLKPRVKNKISGLPPKADIRVPGGCAAAHGCRVLIQAGSSNLLCGPRALAFGALDFNQGVLAVGRKFAKEAPHHVEFAARPLLEQPVVDAAQQRIDRPDPGLAFWPQP